MASKSAGIIAYRMRPEIEVLLVHPGGPFWRNKDLGAWSIPKGEYADGQDAEATARREFAEELGLELTVPLVALGQVKQRGGKIVTAFAAEVDIDTHSIRSNTFQIEWPMRSGKRQDFPEVDRAEFFALDEAGEKINEGQRPLLARPAGAACRRRLPLERGDRHTLRGIAQTGFSLSVTGEVTTRNTRSVRPEFEIACSTPGGRKITSCLRTTWFLPAISISPSPSST